MICSLLVQFCMIALLVGTCRAGASDVDGLSTEPAAVERWGIYEIALTGPAVEIRLWTC